MSSIVPGKPKTDSAKESNPNTGATVSNDVGATTDPLTQSQGTAEQNPEVRPAVSTSGDNMIATTVIPKTPENTPTADEVGEASEAASEAVVDTTRKAAEAINLKNLTGGYQYLPGDELEEEIQSAEEQARTVAAFKHRRIRRFKVGKFEFRDHLLFLTSEEDLESFYDAYQGLAPEDRNAIVKYDFERAAQLESPVTATKAIRGALGTKQIKDPKVVQNQSEK